MKNKLLKLLPFFFPALLFGSCKKQLNVFPTTSEVDGDVIKDQQSAQEVLGGVYYRFADAGVGNGPATFWTDINEIIPSELSGTLFYPYYGDPIASFTVDSSFSNVDSIWNYGYALINAANGFIKNVTPVSNIPSTAKRQMIAEAKFLRAFANSELLLYYGQYNDPSSKYGIILRDTFVTAANLILPRSSVAAAYTAILSDLDSAIEGLPTLNTAIYFANASDAKLLKARVLMNRGAIGDDAQVVDLTNDIITNGPFVLEDSLKDIFLTKGFASSEVMLGVQPFPNENEKFQNYIVNREDVATDSLVSLLANDSRNQWIYQTVTDPFSGSANILTKYYSGDTINFSLTPLSGNCYAFRLSEAYLLEAEAVTLSTGDLATAKTLLTTVMLHAGAGALEIATVSNASTPSALQLEIIKENLRNFTCENGVDWFALRRLPFAAMQQLNPNIQDPNKLIWPIPAAELVVNKVFQNPGY